MLFSHQRTYHDVYHWHVLLELLLVLLGLLLLEALLVVVVVVTVVVVVVVVIGAIAGRYVWLTARRAW